MPSLAQEMAGTRTARWYRLLRSERWSAAWEERRRCFDALADMLANPRSIGDGCRSYLEVSPPSLTDIARQTHTAPATLYKWWGTRQGGQTIPRWAGQDNAFKPGTAFMAEAKIVSFWPYRSGCLHIADAFDMSPAETARAYYRSLAAWASDVPILAACRPSGQPGCTGEDFEIIARHGHFASSGDCAHRAERLVSLAAKVVARILEDASLTPLGAFNTVRDDVIQLFTAPADPIGSRVHEVLAELADRLLHRGDDEIVMTPSQSSLIRAELEALQLLLAEAARLSDGDTVS